MQGRPSLSQNGHAQLPDKMPAVRIFSAPIGISPDPTCASVLIYSCSSRQAAMSDVFPTIDRGQTADIRTAGK